MQAMAALSQEDSDNPGKKVIDLYVAKQTAYTDAVERKTKAFNAALLSATNDPANRTVAQQRAAYDKWVSENERTYANFVQAAYMDWVVTGKKEHVEFWFSVVDSDTAMSLVEQSKVNQRHGFTRDPSC